MRRLAQALSVMTLLTATALSGAAWAAPEGPARLEAVRQSWQKGDLARAANELQQVLADLQTRLGEQIAKTLPAAPPGWEAGEPETQSLASAGGGLSVAKGYQKGDATLNASVLLDNPAVEGVRPMFENGALAAMPQFRRLTVGGEPALMRWDQDTRSGEVMIVLAGRALVQVEGSDLANAELLSSTAEGFNLAALKKIVGG